MGSLLFEGWLSVSSPLIELLRERFDALGVGGTKVAWAKFLDGLDNGTLSRILNGGMALTPKRAGHWAELLWPNDPVNALTFAELMLSAAQQSATTLTVDDFCDEAVRQGGWLGAERISDLFTALSSSSVLNPLVVIEYRDTPRAGPDAKYQALGKTLAEAVLEGIHIAMVVPFQTRASKGEAEGRVRQSNAMKYMIDIQDECVRAYSNFRNLAEAQMEEDKIIEDYLRLYFPGDDVERTLSPGFQAKIFYVQFDDRETQERHYRVFQWVSTPPQDLLIYRGGHIKAEALRDSFFPIPHLFDLSGEPGIPRRALPEIPSGEPARAWLKEKSEELEKRWPDSGLPLGKSLWTTDHEAR